MMYFRTKYYHLRQDLGYVCRGLPVDELLNVAYVYDVRGVVTPLTVAISDIVYFARSL